MTTPENEPKKVDKNKEVVDEVTAFFTDFIKESDRAAVVVGAAKLDILLRQLLQRYLLPNTGSSDDLLDSERPLGTFSARIHACNRLGLIDAEMTRALHLVRRIRNEFAHETSAINLSAGSYADRIRDLVAPLKNLRHYTNMYMLDDLSHVSGAAKDFRVAMGLLCSRLQLAVHEGQQISVGTRTDLVPSYWRNDRPA